MQRLEEEQLKGERPRPFKSYRCTRKNTARYILGEKWRESSLNFLNAVPLGVVERPVQPKPGKYLPHQSTRECERRAFNVEWEEYEFRYGTFG